ncbi:MAG: class II glutamine amidotransferase [Oscillospiraceae bacterium]|nr:class II glutamine amidotransferase [Oscillospiraceae bacterium]
MCQLFGVSAKEPVNIGEKLKLFWQNSCIHAHGWGYASLQPEGSQIAREAGQALSSKYINKWQERPICADKAFAHIRYATIGGLEIENCHPFAKRDSTGREWVLMHQGTIFDYHPTNEYIFSQSGSTDSERILLLLVDTVNRAIEENGGELDSERRFAVIENLIFDMAEGNKLNLAIYDGELLYLHSNYRDTLYLSREDETLFFCTVKLFDGTWEPLPLCTLVSFKDANTEQFGSCHGKEYFDNEADQKYLYEGFANL